MQIDILSLFPNYFKGPFDESIVKRAIENKIIDIRLVDIRQFADNKFNRVDDRPYGGGPGMVLMPEPVAKAIQSVKTDKSHVVYLSPQGSVLTAQKSRELSKKEHLILLCGAYEGVDERVLQTEVDEEISIGDYVLTNGCLAAIVLVDAMVRFVPGVIGHEEAANNDSFENGLCDCSHYTRPANYKGHLVPEVLLSGNHKKIAEWRQQSAEENTKKKRPDLIEKQKKC